MGLFKKKSESAVNIVQYEYNDNYSDDADGSAKKKNKNKKSKGNVVDNGFEDEQEFFPEVNQSRKKTGKNTYRTVFVSSPKVIFDQKQIQKRSFKNVLVHLRKH